MDKSGSLELRKLFSQYTEGESAAGNVAGCIITSDGSIKGEFSEKLLKNEKKTILKYYTLFRKVLSSKNEDISFLAADKAENGHQYLLDRINATKLENKDINRIMYEKIARGLPEGSFAVLLMQYRYDVPVRDKNRERHSDDYGGSGIYGNESSEVYTFLIAAVCPVSTSKEALGYDEDTEKIGEIPQLKTLGNPLFGFLFPNFTDRSSDVDSVSCFRTLKLDLSEDFFGQMLPKLEKPEKKKKEEPVEGVSGEMPGASSSADANNVVVSSDRVSAGLSVAAPDDSNGSDGSNENVSSLDTGYTAPAESSDSGEDFVTADEDGFSEPVSSGDEGMTEGEVKTALNMPRLSDKPVKITGDKNKIEKRVINGEQVWVIRVADASVS